MALTPAERVGRNIRRIRRAADLSQETCAERAGLGRPSMTAYERGRREARLGTLLKIAGALEVGPADLCEGVRWEPRQGRFVVEGP